MTNSYLVSDVESSFLWELEASRDFVFQVEARNGLQNRVFTDTRAKVAFLDTFVETHGEAANDAIRVKAEFRPHIGQLLADAQALYPMARVPIIGAC